MPRNATLNASLTEMVLNEDPASLSPREAASIADRLMADDGVAERVLAGDTSLEQWIGELRCRADQVDPWSPYPFADGSADREVHRALIRSQWEREDHDREANDRAAVGRQAMADIDKLNARVRDLTDRGWDDRVAFEIAQKGEAETKRCLGLQPAAYERGVELPRRD